MLKSNHKKIYLETKNPFIQSRLDYFFISSHLTQKVINCDIKPSIKTDHSLLTLNIKLKTGERRGPSFWKFNNSLLRDEIYIDYIKEIIMQLKEDLKHLENKGLKWDLIKSEIRQRTITYTKTQTKLRNMHENELREKYEKLSADTQSKENLTEIESIKTEIENINKQKTEGSQIRAKAIDVVKKQDSSFYKQRS